MQMALVVLTGYLVSTAPVVDRLFARARRRRRRPAPRRRADGGGLDGAGLGALGPQPGRQRDVRAPRRSRRAAGRLPAARHRGLPRHGHDVACGLERLGAAAGGHAGALPRTTDRPDPADRHHLQPLQPGTRPGRGRADGRRRLRAPPARRRERARRPPMPPRRSRRSPQRPIRQRRRVVRSQPLAHRSARQRRGRLARGARRQRRPVPHARRPELHVPDARGAAASQGGVARGRRRPGRASAGRRGAAVSALRRHVRRDRGHRTGPDDRQGHRAIGHAGLAAGDGSTGIRASSTTSSPPAARSGRSKRPS